MRLTVPASIIIMMITFGFASGIALGSIIYCVIMALTGELRQVKKIMCGPALLFVLKFIVVGV